MYRFWSTLNSSLKRADYAIREASRSFARHRYRACAIILKVRFHVVAGATDSLISVHELERAYQVMDKAAPREHQVSFRVIPACGHVPFLEHPEQFLEACGLCVSPAQDSCYSSVDAFTVYLLLSIPCPPKARFREHMDVERTAGAARKQARVCTRVRAAAAAAPWGTLVISLQLLRA
jgi:hypothetical protein